jgi:voltage-gated potassium channel
MDNTGRPYVIVDTDISQNEKTLDTLKNHVYVEGNATDDAILLKSGIMDAKGLFAVTGDDNQNLVISLTAKQLNHSIKVVARCSDTSNTAKMQKAGADNVISPDQIGGLRMASEMVRPTVVSFLDIMLRDTEKNLRVEEVTAPELIAGQTIKSLGLKDHSEILLMAIRAGTDWVYNPPADYTIKPQDTLVFMTTSDARRELENIIHNMK